MSPDPSSQDSPCSPIPIYIGYDPRERAATNVLIDSLYQHASRPIAVTPIVAAQLGALFRREIGRAHV